MLENTKKIKKNISICNIELKNQTWDFKILKNMFIQYYIFLFLILKWTLSLHQNHSWKCFNRFDWYRSYNISNKKWISQISHYLKSARFSNPSPVHLIARWREKKYLTFIEGKRNSTLFWQLVPWRLLQFWQNSSVRCGT